MKIRVPSLSLVVLVGTSGSGKTTFARKHFKPTEVLSSDTFRGIVSDDEKSQEATRDAFDALHHVAGIRLKRGLLTVIDATNVQEEARRPLIELARAWHVLPVAIVLDLPTRLCVERNARRPGHDVGGRVIGAQHAQLSRSIRNLKREGFRHLWVLDSPEQIDAVEIERVPLWCDRRHDLGPLDIIGDVHGCFDELTALLTRLGYRVEGGSGAPVVTPPEGRRAAFLGDLVDRGPDSPGVLRLVMGMVEAGTALCVPGNHDVKLMRKLRGAKVKVAHGLERTLEQIEGETDEFRTKVADFVDRLVAHQVLDEGRLVLAHAGMKEAFQGRASGAVREFALYGETTGEIDHFGLPERVDWALDYRGSACVVYGHTPVPTADWVNRTINIDTGCVFGGALTALRWPERELVSVPAIKTWYEPARPVGARPAPSRAREHADLLDLDDVAGKRVVSTRVVHAVTLREENTAAALEVMSRFAVDPRWLVYLPPTMSPSETAPDGPWLERPAEAFAYFKNNGVSSVVCQEKHMGSRAVVVLCRDPGVAAARFHIDAPAAGAVYTRTGRPFFRDAALEAAFLERLRDAVSRAGLWERLQSGWLVLDAELLPWSEKAQELLRDQYARTGVAARTALADATRFLEAARARASNPELESLAARYARRQDAAERYVAAYRRYCWPVAGLDDLVLAPFHLLASEGAVHSERDHAWHMETLAALAEADPGFLRATAWQRVDLADEGSVAEATAWWEALVGAGGEGMVVKPLRWTNHGPKGLVQPAIKCRGPEYLRIIYGPEYALPENLERLRRRGLGTKRKLAMQEYALGLEALFRFVEGEALYRVHECVFGVLALESEPVDPRL